MAVADGCVLRVSDLCQEDEATGELRMQEGRLALVRLHDVPGVAEPVVSLTGLELGHCHPGIEGVCAASDNDCRGFTGARIWREAAAERLGHTP